MPSSGVVLQRCDLQDAIYLTTRQRHAHKQLRRRTDITIKAADNGSGTVIMDRDWYINECLRQLNDTKFYRRLDTDTTSDIQTHVEVYIIKTTAQRRFH